MQVANGHGFFARNQNLVQFCKNLASLENIGIFSMFSS